MPNKLALAAIGLWLASVAAAGVYLVKGSTLPASDGRIAVLLSVSERDYVLGEMRTMLGALRDVTEALGEGDRGKTASEARAASTHGGREAPLGLMTKLPLNFKAAGMAMHESFAALAEAVGKDEETPALTRRLGETIGLCVGCHATYRLDTEGPAR